MVRRPYKVVIIWEWRFERTEARGDCKPGALSLYFYTSHMDSDGRLPSVICPRYFYGFKKNALLSARKAKYERSRRKLRKAVQLLHTLYSYAPSSAQTPKPEHPTKGRKIRIKDSYISPFQPSPTQRQLEQRTRRLKSGGKAWDNRSSKIVALAIWVSLGRIHWE